MGGQKEGRGYFCPAPRSLRPGQKLNTGRASHPTPRPTPHPAPHPSGDEASSRSAPDPLEEPPGIILDITLPIQFALLLVNMFSLVGEADSKRFVCNPTPIGCLIGVAQGCFINGFREHICFGIPFMEHGKPTAHNTSILKGLALGRYMFVQAVCDDRASPHHLVEGVLYARLCRTGPASPFQNAVLIAPATLHIVT